MKPMKITLVAGGTGGHVFPSLALAEHLHERLGAEGLCLEIITDQRGAKFIKNPEGIQGVHVFPVQRRPKWFYPLALMGQGVCSLIHFIRHRPQAVIGFGGYPSLMPLAIAQWLGIPTFVHEQNRYLGKANRWAAKRAHRVWLSHESDGVLPARSRVVGNFIRHSLCHIPVWTAPDQGAPLRVLIVGGSQGAAVLGANLAELLAKSGLSLEIIHQCRDVSAVEAVYRFHKISHYVTSFVEDIAARYGWAHLVIARAGASTVGELVAAKRPAIFVPFASAVEGDQSHNAAHAASWSWTIHEKHLDMLLPSLLGDIKKDISLLSQKVDAIPDLKMDMDAVVADLLKAINE